MVVNFSNITFKETPLLILRNLDGVPIQTLGYAFNVKANFCYNEISELNFDYPAFIDGKKTPNYDNIVGMRIIELLNIGQFLLINPVKKNDGTKEIKTCKAYSLEYEFTSKKISLANSTYNFWNPTSVSDSVLGIILEKMPSWSIGTIDSSLVGKYRTFEINEVNIYDLVKNTLQKSYNCIFEFDTFNRKINVKDVNLSIPINPVYISTDNLIKEIEINEDTENIFTCLDVNGAENVDIRAVNPLGTNKIYNLDYFMNTSNFTQAFIDKWIAWKNNFNSNQTTYYNLVVQSSLQTARLATEKAVLVSLETQLSSLEILQSTYIEAIAQGIDKQTDLNTVNTQIATKKTEIANQKTLITNIQTNIDNFTASLKSINTNTAFNKFFTAQELLILDRYFKEDSIQESSFVVSSVKSYKDAGSTNSLLNITFSLTNSDVTQIYGVANKTLFDVKGGTLTTNDTTIALNSNVVKMSLERNTTDGTFVLSAYLSDGNIYNGAFSSGCISATGTCGTISNNITPDSQTPDAYGNGTYLTFVVTGNLYFTKNVTDYEKYAVEWDLYEYGKECLSKLAYPSYTFSINSANFLALDDFIAFKNSINLGNKIYLNINESTILNPVVVSVEVDFENPDKFSVIFSDKYRLSDSAFSLADMLEESISMGKTVDFSKYSYSAFIDSGASTSVKTFMDSALDVSKNAVLSSSGQAASWDSSGIHLRKWNDAKTAYLNEQIRMINNSIVFTDNAWSTAKMAIGKFTDSNLGSCWGVVAPNIVGTLLTGSNLVIESAKKDGGKSVFKVDANGATLYNSVFDVYNSSTTTQITLNPNSGFAIGTYPLYSGDHVIDTTKAKFWVDTSGNVNMKGNVTANNFYFNDGGNIKTLLSQAQTKIPKGYLDLGNIQLDGTTGDITTTGNVTLGGNINITGNIAWSSSNSPVQVQYSVDGSTNWHTAYASSDYFARYSYNGGSTWTSAIKIQGVDGRNGSDANVPGYIKSTYIDMTSVQAPYIAANLLELRCPQGYSNNAGLLLTGYHSGVLKQILQIYYFEGTAPAVHFSSPCDAPAYWDYGYTVVKGNVEFQGSVSGVTACFG